MNGTKAQQPPKNIKNPDVTSTTQVKVHNAASGKSLNSNSFTNISNDTDKNMEDNNHVLDFPKNNAKGKIGKKK